MSIMEQIIELILKNREWLFSGAGVAVLGLLIRVLTKRRRKLQGQSIQSGNGSVNIQAGRDVKVRSDSK